MTQPQLANLVRLWQRRLRLRDWKVSAEFGTAENMPDCIGQIFPDSSEMTATLRVIDGEVIEGTVIHELLHLRLLPFSDGDDAEPNHEEREKTINLLADCFQAAYPRRKS